LSGIELLRLARARKNDLPALIITGYADLESIDRRPEGVGVLQKPFSIEALSREIANVLAG